jgi:uncharacterized protein YceK
MLGGYIIMKKAIAVILTMITAVALSGCGIVKSGVSSITNGGLSAPTPVVVGDTVVMDNYELTIKTLEVTYEVWSETEAEDTMFRSYYAADPGQVYIHLSADVKNTGKTQLRCKEVLGLSADYNNGYKYEGSIMAIDTPSLGLYTAALASIDPLDTMRCHWGIKCPEEVETSGNPLVVTIKIDGNTYECVMR